MIKPCKPPVRVSEIMMRGKMEKPEKKKKFCNCSNKTFDQRIHDARYKFKRLRGTLKNRFHNKIIEYKTMMLQRWLRKSKND